MDALENVAKHVAENLANGNFNEKNAIKNMYNLLLWYDIRSKNPTYTIALHNLALSAGVANKLDLNTNEERLAFEIFIEDLIEAALPIFIKNKKRCVMAIRSQMWKTE